MACNVCGEYGLLNCDQCSKDLGESFYCFESVGGWNHFCSVICFERWLAYEYRGSLVEAKDDGTLNRVE